MCLVLVGCTATNSPDASSSPPETAPATITTLPESPDTTPSETNAAPTGPFVPSGNTETLANGLESPWSIVMFDDLVLVSERDTGRVLELTEAGNVVVGTIPGVRHGGEGGLLGLATLDNFLYAYSTGDNGNRVQRFPVSGSPGSLSLGEPETIIEGIPAASTHNGGRIEFGPDGMLYITTGDAASPNLAQDAASLAGKILRLTPEGEVPADNPFAGSPVFSLGHRNPQGLAWAADGTMYAAEFGQNTWDELNIIVPGGNYGWPTVEGIANTDGFINPVLQWAPSEASPSGIAVVGDSIFIANLRGQVLRVVPASDPATSTEFFAGEFGRIRHVFAAPDGSLWLLTNNTDGRGNPRENDDQLVRIELQAA